MLDLDGYVDCHGDGWQQQPDGAPLVLQVAAEADQLNRQIKEKFQEVASAMRL